MKFDKMLREIKIKYSLVENVCTEFLTKLSDYEKSWMEIQGAEKWECLDISVLHQNVDVPT